MDLRGVYFITDRTYSAMPVFEMVEAVLSSGIKIIQYRDKTASRREVYLEAVRLRELTSRFDALLIINDYADIALAVGADGVHLGQDDLPLRDARRLMGRKIIGISTHSLEEAKEAEAEGADYIGYGPIFHTSTKDAGSPRGLDNLMIIKQNVSVPVVAIGGINADNIADIFKAGADAAAVATGICRGEIASNARALIEIYRFKNNIKQFKTYRE